MFSRRLGRVIRSTGIAASTSAIAAARGPSTSLAVIRPLCQSAHQRRESSSKTSIPPDGPKRTAPSQQASGSTGRLGRRKTKESALAPDTRNQPFSKQYPNLPSVPSTQHLRPKDINVSSFFSLHRPISVTTAIPNASTEAQFNSIFEPRTQASKKKYDEVIFTLNNLADSLDPYTEQEDDGGLHWQVINEAQLNGDPRHLDGVPRDIPLDKLLSQMRPYKPPPPPQAFTDPSSTSSAAKKKTSKTRSTTPRQKQHTIIVTLTEFTDKDGEKSYAASGTPIIRLPNSEQQTMVSPWDSERTIMRQPFLDRMRIRQLRWQDYRDERDERSNMLLISVKRQRKLKMKKHKYKKLMRKTRNLRRKLGKL